MSSEEWSCSVCTYINSSSRTKCEMCETAKPEDEKVTLNKNKMNEHSSDAKNQNNSNDKSYLPKHLVMNELINIFQMELSKNFEVFFPVEIVEIITQFHSKYLLRDRSQIVKVYSFASTDGCPRINDIISIGQRVDRQFTVTESTGEHLPTLGELKTHDVVLVSLYNCADYAKLGNLLADYVDSGGDIVMIWPVNSWTGRNILGRFETDGYDPFENGNMEYDKHSPYKVITENHPLLEGVGEMSAGRTNIRSNFKSVRSGEVEVPARWSDDALLAGIRTDKKGLVTALGVCWGPQGYGVANTRMLANALCLTAARSK